MNVDFTLTNGIYVGDVDDSVFGVSRTIELEELSYDSVNEVYAFELRDWWIVDYTRDDIPKEEAEDQNNNIDPGKVLIWLLKKLKEALCPECQ